jgi:hypothetical protein
LLYLIFVLLTLRVRHLPALPIVRLLLLPQTLQIGVVLLHLAAPLPLDVLRVALRLLLPLEKARVPRVDVRRVFLVDRRQRTLPLDRLRRRLLRLRGRLQPLLLNGRRLLLLLLALLLNGWRLLLWGGRLRPALRLRRGRLADVRAGKIGS